MNKLEMLINFYEMHQKAEPLGLNICRQFMKLDPPSIYPFMKDSFKLFIQMTKDSRENLIRFRELYGQFTEKINTSTLIYNNDLLRAISDDLEHHHTQVGEIISQDIELSKNALRIEKPSS